MLRSRRAFDSRCPPGSRAYSRSANSYERRDTRRDRDELHSPCATGTAPPPCPRRRCRRGHRPATASWTSMIAGRRVRARKKKRRLPHTHVRRSTASASSFLRPRDRLTGLPSPLAARRSLPCHSRPPPSLVAIRAIGQFRVAHLRCQACLARGESPPTHICMNYGPVPSFTPNVTARESCIFDMLLPWHVILISDEFGSISF